MKWHETYSPYRGTPSHGTGSTVVERKGYVVRTRGDTLGAIEHEYECPVHGRFRAMVPRADVPNAIRCHCPTGHKRLIPLDEWHNPNAHCVALWVPPLVGIGKSSGEVVE